MGLRAEEGGIGAGIVCCLSNPQRCGEGWGCQVGLRAEEGGIGAGCSVSQQSTEVRGRVGVSGGVQG